MQYEEIDSQHYLSLLSGSARKRLEDETELFMQCGFHVDQLVVVAPEDGSEPYVAVR